MIGKAQKSVILCTLVTLCLSLQLSLAHASGHTPAPITQTSQFEQAAEDAWQLPGFRIGLAYEFNRVASLGYQPTMLTNGFSIRPYYRFENDWGIGSTITYGVPLTGNTGLRWSLALEGTWWFFDQLGISLGVGYAGLMLGCDLESNPCTQTLPNMDRQTPQQEDRWLEEGEEFKQCTGDGAIFTTRLDYNFSVENYFATGPYIQSYYQTVRCELETGSSNPETGQLLKYLDTWSYFGAAAGWWFTWR